MSARQQGFTLLEALVAMAIFSFIGVAAYNLLASTGRLKESGDAGYAALSGMQLAMRQIEEDVSQFTPRSVAGKGREGSDALDAAPEDAVVEFTRAGWRNPLGLPRSGLQRVAWAVDEDGRLLRRYRRVIDDTDPDELLERVYVSEVTSLELRYLDDKGKWQESWPPETTVASAPPEAGEGGSVTAAGIPPEPVPVAIDVRIEHARLGELNRVIPLH